MYSSTSTNPTLNDLTASLLTINPNEHIYFYKDSNGTIKCNKVEHQLNNVNYGYPFQFINGEVVYSTVPLVYLTIPFNYPYTLLQSNSLWDSSLCLWIDAKDARTFNISNEKILSKSYSDTMSIVESSSQTLVYDNVNYCFDLTNNCNLETSNTIQILNNFKLAMVVNLTQQNVTGVIFQYNNLVLKISSEVQADTTTQYSINLYENNTYKKSICFNSNNDTSFKYYIYVDNSDLKVSGNTSVLQNSYSMYQNTSSKIYFGQNSSGSLNSKIKIYEVLFYQSSSSISVSESNMWTYLSGRWNLTTFTDSRNVIPFLTPLSITNTKLYFQYTDYGTGQYITNHNNGSGTNVVDLNSFGHSFETNITHGSYTAKKRITMTSTGSTKYFTIMNTNNLPVYNTSAFTLIAVMSANQNDGSSAISFNSNNFVFCQQIWGVFQSYNSGYGSVQFNLNGGQNVSTNQYNIISLVFNGGTIYSQSTMICRINGLPASNPYSSATTFTESAITNGHIMYMNASANLSLVSLYFNTSALSSDVVAKIEGFMVHENFVNANVSNILTTNHPYYSSPPTSF